MDSQDASEGKMLGILPHINPNKLRHPQIQIKRFPQLSAFQYAQFALSCYEKKADAENLKFEVKKTLGACRTLLRFPGYDEVGVGDWCHVSFIAKPLEGCQGSEFFFFAELGDISEGRLSLMNWFKSDPDYSGMALGCGFCPSTPEYPHPPKFVGGSERGRHYQDSQNELLKCFELQLNEPKGGSAPPLVNHQAAELALRLMEERGKGEFQLVRPYANYCWVGSYNHMVGQLVQWGHVSFSAKPRPKNGEDCNDASEKLIFAELVDYGEGEFILKACAVLDPHDSRITQGCRLCPSNGDHPHPGPRKYTLGHEERNPFYSLYTFVDSQDSALMPI